MDRAPRMAAQDSVVRGRSTGGRPARAAPPQVASAEVELASMPPQVAQAALSEAVADRGVRLHYVSSATPESGSEPQSEVISVVLEGADVSIIVRDAVLTDAQALRAAFETARELTGRSGSLQQLTLNGRTVYQQASGGAQPAEVLFAC